MTLSLAATALGWLITYALICWTHPFGRCWWCRADGRNAAGYCNACHGSGRRVRLGRRLYNTARREYRDGTK